MAFSVAEITTKLSSSVLFLSNPKAIGAVFYFIKIKYEIWTSFGACYCSFVTLCLSL